MYIYIYICIPISISIYLSLSPYICTLYIYTPRARHLPTGVRGGGGRAGGCGGTLLHPIQKVPKMIIGRSQTCLKMLIKVPKMKVGPIPFPFYQRLQGRLLGHNH